MVILVLCAAEASPSFRLKEHSKLYSVKEQPSSTSGPFTGKIRRFQTADGQVIVLQTAPLSVTLLSTPQKYREILKETVNGLIPLCPDFGELL